MRVVLQVESGEAAGHRAVLLPGQTLRVGRTDWADLSVPDPQVSCIHFELEAAEGACRVRDLKSCNGTLVNGRRIEAAPLFDGDRLTAGQTTFLVRIEGGAAPPPHRDVALQTAAIVPGSAPPAGPIVYRRAACDSGLVRLIGCGPDPHPATVASLAAKAAPLHLIVDFAGRGEPLPEAIGPPEHLIDWLPPESRARYSPVVLAAAELKDLCRIVAGAWGKDALLGVFSTGERAEVLAHLRRAAGAFCRPSVVASQLTFCGAPYVDFLLKGIEAVLAEEAGTARWTIFAREPFCQTLANLGFQEAPATEQEDCPIPNPKSSNPNS